MGNCGSLPEGEAAGASAPASGGGFSETEIAERRSKVLDKEIRDLERRQATEIKILLLGNWSNLPWHHEISKRGLRV